MTPPHAHIVFDLDGTLIDSAPDLAAAINRLLAEEGRRVLALGDVIAMIGDGAPRLVARAFAATGAVPERDAMRALQQRFLAHYADDLTANTRAYPGVEATLAALYDSGWRFAVCTNKPTAPARQTLDALGLAHWFEAVLGPDLAPARKPDPAHVHAVMAELGASRAVMVGDSAHDMAAGRAAGLALIAVSYGYHRGEIAALGADQVIDSFAELPAALARLA